MPTLVVVSAYAVDSDESIQVFDALEANFGVPLTSRGIGPPGRLSCSSSLGDCKTAEVQELDEYRLSGLL
jgi:hypothetical protein